MFIFDKIPEEDLPSEIESKNVFNATLEIHYDINSVPAGVLIGAIYSNEHFRENYNMPQQTPISSIPQQIRQQNPNLQNTLDFLLNSKDGIFQIGAGLGTLVLYIIDFNYVSWEKAFSEMRQILNTVNSILPPFKNRVGVRFVNFFSNTEIFKSLELDCKVFDNDILKEPFSLTCINKITDDTEMKLIITNPVSLERSPNQYKQDGFIIDIDVVTNKKMDNLDMIEQIFNKNHLLVKRAFFGLFDNETIDAVLKPCKGESDATS